jgi:formate dehydrogenase subunit gamma
MTVTRTSAPRTASEATVARFGATERTLHWVHASATLGMIATGAVLYLPWLAALVGDRPLVKAVHLGIAGVWLTALAAITVGGDRRQLRRTRQELERYVAEDLRWLMGRPAHSGRFNAGQKVHATLQAALSVLFAATGALLWLGERNTALRFPGTIAVHDACAALVVALVAGHLHLALIHPSTRPALQGMTRGAVSAAFARRHHAAWTPEALPPRRHVLRARVAAGLIAAAGLAGTAAIVLGGLHAG